MRKYILGVFVLCIGQVVLGQVTYPPAGQSTYIINSGQTINVTDGQSITFGPGTHIKSGATFSAVIADAPIITTANDPYSNIGFSNENYIFTRSYYKAMSSFSTSNLKEGDVMESITYFDGLGRPMQAIGIKGAPDKEDIISHIEYDEYGRQEKEWLPYHESSGTLGSYRGDKASATRSYYKANYPEDFTSLNNSTANAYSEKEFEPSPLNRVLKQAAPGQDWRLGQGHEIELEYHSNATNEVRRFEVTTTFANNTYTPSLVQNGYYGAGELYKTITKDENHTGGVDRTTEEFTDKQGRVVLKRTFLEDEHHNTYYVYDDFGNLTYVISPQVTTASVSTTELNELCYQYKYDHRNRLVEKKIPGKGWEFIVYDKLDRPILTQDANQDNANEWLFTKYDAFGRVAYTGQKNANINRTVYQEVVNDPARVIQFEKRTAADQMVAGTKIYYTIDTTPIIVDKIYTINYYDTYVDTEGLSVPNTVYGQAKTTNTQGLPTVSKVRVLDTNDWITTITGYDVKGRPIYTASKNTYLNTIDIVETELDFGGRVLRTKTSHTKGNSAAIVTEESYTYDHEGRLLQQKQTINGQNQETIAANTYDNLGQLTIKEVGGGLQTVDYDYNVRGWLKEINDTGDLTKSGQPADLFAFKIDYNTSDHSTAKLYNGNISATEWRTANDNSLRWYTYNYDPMNRLHSARSYNGDYDVREIFYDRNGNIQTLVREGHVNSNATSFGEMDDLYYSYSGNKLTKVLDNGNDTYGFKDGANTTTEYTYDQNGNMTSDLNKGILDIEYNFMNLPTKVTVNGSGGNGNIQYIYAADGTKLKKTLSTTGVETLYAGDYIYEKPPNSDAKLQFFSTPEGYVEPKNPDNLSLGYDYVFQYKDHLGNVRLSYSDANGDGAINPSTEILQERNFYPFGLEHRGYNNVIVGTENNQKTFQGKEKEEELGRNTYDFGWRAFDPAIARWTNIDPLSERYLKISPYVFTANNPIYNIEVDGRYFEGKDEKRAARLQRKAEKRSAKLNKRADKLEAKGKDVGDLRERAGELTQSSQDIQDLRNDESTQYRYASANGKEAKSLGIKGQPATVGTGTNSNGDNVVTMFTGSKTGQKLHETRHGGQHYRGEINAITQTSSIDAEVSAYRAQYSYSGSLSAMTLNASTANIQDIQGLSNTITGQLNRDLLDSGNYPAGVGTTNITNINQVTRGFVNNVVEVGNGGIPGQQNLLLWIYSTLR